MRANRPIFRGCESPVNHISNYKSSNDFNAVSLAQEAAGVKTTRRGEHKVVKFSGGVDRRNGGAMCANAAHNGRTGTFGTRDAPVSVH
jgi:hypothetical protein